MPQKRFLSPEHLYFVTVNTQDRYPYFEEEIFCDLWIEELKVCKQLKPFKLYAFCLIPDHFHMLVQCDEGPNISEVMQFFKRHFSRNANIIMNDQIPVTDIGQCRLQINNENESIIGLFDQKIMHLQSLFHKKHTIKFDIPKLKWQKSFHDHVIRDEEDLVHHFNDTQFNFQKHDLPQNWKYTSLNFEDLIDPIE